MRELAFTNFRDELAKLAFLVVPIQVRVRFCVVSLQFLQFIADLFSVQVRFRYFVSPASPDFQGVLAFVEQLFVPCANSSFEGKFLAHVSPLPHVSGPLSRTI